MKITIEGTPEVITKIFQAIESSKKQDITIHELSE